MRLAGPFLPRHIACCGLPRLGDCGTLGVDGPDGVAAFPDTAAVPTVGLHGGTDGASATYVGDGSSCIDGELERVDWRRWNGARPSWAGVGARTNLGKSVGGGISPGGSSGALPGVIGVPGVLVALE